MELDNYEAFFLLTIDDLRGRIANNTTYDTIRACGLCRQLIIDKRKQLFWLANQKIKLRLVFEVCHPVKITFQTASGKSESPKIVWNNIIPFSHNKHIVDEKQFKEMIIYRRPECVLSVDDVIHAASNFMGGIHIRPTQSKKEQVWYALHEATKNDTNLAMASLKSICKVILKAMEPLEAAIKGRTPAAGLSPEY
jgi:hypothetical protein